MKFIFCFYFRLRREVESKCNERSSFEQQYENAVAEAAKWRQKYLQ